MPEKNAESVVNKPTVTEYECPYMRKPKEKSSIWRRIYNKDKNYILGRTLKSWGLLLIFYTSFYSGLALLFSLCMMGLLAHLSEVEPKFTLDDSLIGTNPGLVFRPISSKYSWGINSKPNLASPISRIEYNATEPEQVDFWKKEIEEFLDPYKNYAFQNGGDTNVKHCNFNSSSSNKVCYVDVNNLGDCSIANSFNYHKSAPCVFLKINKIYNWVPEYYDDYNSLPGDMPADLKAFIKSVPEKERKQIWVSCTGKNPSDASNIGPIKYFPSRGFPSYYYPYTNTPGYLSPLIAVQFERPIIGSVINVECRIWAKNIQYNGSLRDRQGSIHFEILIQ